MVKPVDLIARARRRLALVAATHEAARWAAPALTGLILAAVLGPLGRATWERAGYELPDSGAFAIRLALLATAATALLIGAIRAWLAAVRTGFVDAAVRIDEVVGGHQEVLTLASLSTSSQNDAESRSVLFPMLWRRVANLLESFNPETVFNLEVAAPLRRSSVIALSVVAGLAIATVALMRPPTAMEIQARNLVDVANKIAAEPGGEGLAQQVAAVAKDIQNPRIPPPEKIRKLADLMRQIENQQQQSQPQSKSDQNKPANGPEEKQTTASASATGNGKSGGTGASKSSKGRGTSSAGNGSGGKGEGAGNGPGQGDGSGKGKGSGKDATANNSQNNGQPNNANSSDSRGKQNQQMMELQEQLAKAQAQVQMESAKNPGPKTGPGGNGTGRGPKPGANPNQQLASNQNKDAGQGKNPGATMGEGPKPGNAPGQSGSNKVPGGSQGDTHLGDTPAPVRYERFLKPGESGPVLKIRDTRFVLFRIPTAMPGMAGGKLSVDKAGTRATTAYVNVPLNEANLEVAPDEHQLVPPRYRELIH